MEKLKILLLSHLVDEVPINVGNQFIRAMIDNNALYLDYIEIYNKYGFQGVRNCIKEFIAKNGINCLIYASSPSEFYFDVNYFEKLRKEIFMVMYTGDSECYHDVRDQYYAQAMDLVTVQDFITTFKLRQIGINSMSYHICCDTTKYRKIENLPKNIDVSFIGTLMGRVGRAEYIRYLENNGIHVEIFGAGSPNSKITFEKKIEIINRSKINLDFSGVSEETRLTRKHQIYKRAKQIKGKCIETAICGSFALAEYAPGIEHFLEIGREIDVFHDKEELLKKIKYYLEHEEERENIAKRGYARAIKDYNVKLAVPKLLATLEEFRIKKTYKPSTIYLDEEFIRNYTTYRVLWIIRFIKAEKWKFAYEELKIILKYRKLDWYQIRIFFIEEVLDNFPRIKSFLKLLIEGNKK